jgi:hypothetical protein
MTRDRDISIARIWFCIGFVAALPVVAIFMGVAWCLR